MALGKKTNKYIFFAWLLFNVAIGILFLFVTPLALAEGEGKISKSYAEGDVATQLIILRQKLADLKDQKPSFERKLFNWKSINDQINFSLEDVKNKSSKNKSYKKYFDSYISAINRRIADLKNKISASENVEWETEDEELSYEADDALDSVENALSLAKAPNYFDKILRSIVRKNELEKYYYIHTNYGFNIDRDYMLPEALNKEVKNFISRKRNVRYEDINKKPCIEALNVLGGLDLPRNISDIENIIRDLNSCEKLYADIENALVSTFESLISLLQNLQYSAELKIKESQSEVQNIDNKISSVQKEFTDIASAEVAEVQTNKLIEQGLIIDASARTIIFYTLVAWGIIIVVVVGAILFLSYMPYIKSPEKEPVKEQSERGEFSYSLFLEMMTVFLLTGTILILGLAGKIDKEGLAALIGGISGYVLGRMHGKMDSR